MKKFALMTLPVLMAFAFTTSAMADSRSSRSNSSIVYKAQAVKSDANQLARALYQDYAASALINLAEKIADEAQDVQYAARRHSRGSLSAVKRELRQLESRFAQLQRQWYRYGNGCSLRTERLLYDLEWSIEALTDAVYYNDYDYGRGNGRGNGSGGRIIIRG